MQKYRKLFMQPSILIALILLTVTSNSCNSIHITARQGKDVTLNVNNNTMLEGIYLNSFDDSTADLYSLWQRLNNNTINTSVNASIQLNVIGKKQLRVTLLSGNEVVEEKTLHGKYKKGYFVLKNRYRAKLHFGPFLWSFAGFRIFVGLTKDGNLILLETNAGTAILLLLPIFPAGNQHAFEYKRKK